MPVLEEHSKSQYELPESYEDNNIAIMAVDAHTLYAYWDISNNKMQNLINNIGSMVWENSVPALKITNLTKNSSFFVRINGFSHDWYINIHDSGCIFVAELGRKITDDYFISFATSNHISLPDTSISFNNTACFVNCKYAMESAFSGDDNIPLEYGINVNGNLRRITALMFNEEFGKLPDFEEIYGSCSSSISSMFYCEQERVSSLENFNYEKKKILSLSSFEIIKKDKK
ncbi:MAG TPA: DUF4912 domain-containing protein [Clostridiales bacterium]|nr:DUF4912 domain-containing protein [Clostridiales bacterium]